MNERQKAFEASPIGKAYLRMLSANGNAWMVDSTSENDRRIAEAWDQYETARREFRVLLDALIERAGPEPASSESGVQPLEDK